MADVHQFFGAGDIGPMLEQLGEKVQFNGGLVTVDALIDVTDDEATAASGAGVRTKEKVLTVKTNAALNLAANQVVTIVAEAASYRIVRAHQVEDGATTRIWIARKTT